MKELKFRPSYLQVLYFIILLMLFAFIIYTPTFIRGPVPITEQLIFKEETLEGFLLGVIFILSILILNIYKREVYKHKELIKKIDNDKKKVEDRLLVSDQYIGVVNVQIQEVESIFNSIDKYPQTKTDFNKTLSFFGERILGITNSDWDLIRIINSNTQKTISEHFQTRERFPSAYPHVSNKMIIEKQPMDSCTTVISSPKNLDFLVSCVIPVCKISKEQRAFIQAIINEITMLFVILNSSYSKNGNKIIVEDYPDKKESAQGSSDIN
jgi:hypothetical protein